MNTQQTTNPALKAMLVPAIRNLREAAEFAPAVKQDPEALTDMLSSSEEINLASRILLDPDAEMREERAAGTPDEMVARARENFAESASNLEKIEDHPNVDAFENIIAATDEIVTGVRMFVKS